MSSLVRNEYPRPDFVREQWLNLNGQWRFAFDDKDEGLRQRWFEQPEKLQQSILVPFAYQAPASGIGETDHHAVVWYARQFTIPPGWAGQRVRLHFGAVDYEATVWVNGIPVGSHQGGYVPFSFDITAYLQPEANWVVIRVVDETRIDQPRGKQTARQDPWGCWYTPVTGIWQTVWLEPVHEAHMVDCHLVPDIDTETLLADVTLSLVTDQMMLEAVASAEGREVARVQVPLQPTYTRWSDLRPQLSAHFSLRVPHCQLWSPENPFLYDLELRLLLNGEVMDQVKTYFGMRKVEARSGEVYLNNRAYYQRLVLDQGYWPEGLYTAPSVEAIRRDVELTKAMGFNGARKHQKIEDPYYYYFCDKLGLLVWSEMPSCYEYDERGADRLRREWTEALLRDRNHPCIIAWVPMNESWGVDQLQRQELPQAVSHLLTLYYQTYALDSTRLVVSNDGWQQAETDMLTIHEYTQSADDLRMRLQRFFANRTSAAFSPGLPIALRGFVREDVPILVTEFGGIKVAAQQAEGWGYGEEAADSDEMLERIRRLVDVLLEQPQVVGYCYTQLTDVQQEVNGLLTHDHEPKVPVEKLKEIFRGR